MGTRKVGRTRRASVETPLYRTALVSYVDILGFRALLNEKAGDPDQVRRTVLEVQRNLLHEPDDPDVTAKNLVDIAFSDTVLSVWFLPKPGEYRPGVLYQMLTHLHFAQVELLARGILIRGGISMGDVHVDAGKGVWFGPGIVSAYQLELDADFPRVVLDPHLAVAFRENVALRSSQNSLQHEAQIVSAMVMRDVDGMAYLSPVARDPRMFDEDIDGMVSFYSEARRHLIDSAQKHAKKPSVLRKLTWVANQLEDAVSRLPLELQAGLRLTKTEFPGLHEFV